MQSNSALETKKIARNIAERLLDTSSKVYKGPLVIGFVGDLGSGKTFFVKTFLKFLGVKEKVSSPTFVLMREYKLKTLNKFNKKYKRAYHIDVYRLNNAKDLKHLNFRELLKEKDVIIFIEWADKIKKLLPKNTVWIKFKHGNLENERVIEIRIVF
ncbi:MAG: tRNA (adenosine(37)-N6)-threonylcarbamoyltransferase complex ATPase subunit type 1 TsaE [bacterium]|nr:tRNA (adenosine(37)-N6)-threonylcarbamoyltransferase complex ATPase subunit type 1 TsaE [bacterium]